jgi:ATP-dependent RNA helicase RhlE
MNFTELGLAAPILKALAGEGYNVPTPIQAQAIPAVLAASDLLGIAQTGTGKTAAFALPILHRLAANRHPAPRKGCRVLVLSPTRELASQIAESFRVYGRHLNVTVAVIFGGVAHSPQIKALSRGVDILVATPGRLIDHLTERSVTIAETEIFVLDEADQMLDLGFLKPIRTIVGKLPLKRQNLFFSATMPREIAGLADELLNNPVKIAITPSASTAERVSQRVIHIEFSKKRSLLVELLADPEMARTLVFTRTKRGADRVTRHLESENIPASAIHGNKSQRQREEALKAFRDGKVRVLVATDIAARGIDIDAVSHVINYELPDVPEAYVHRIGRTARAGAAGSAITLCDADELDLLRAIERVTRQSIPSENRRNDSSIAADQSAESLSQARARNSSRGSQAGRGRNGSRDRRDGGADAGRPQQRQARGHSRPADQQRDGRPASRDQAERQNGQRAAMGERAHGERPAGRDHAERPRPQGQRQASGERAHGERPAGRDHAERPRPQGQRQAPAERTQGERGRQADASGGRRQSENAGGRTQQKQHTGNRKKYKPARQWSASAPTA